MPANASEATGVSSDKNQADAVLPPLQNSAPVADPAASSQEGVATQNPEAPTAEEAVDEYEDEFGKPLGTPEESDDPVAAANTLLKTAPGRMRLY